MKAITYSKSVINKFSITHYLTVFCVFFTLFCPDKAQNIISAIGILSFGILHGANDIKILVKKNSTSKPLLKFFYLISYVTIVLLGVSIFYFLPAFTPNIEKNITVKRSYSPWFWIGFLSFYSAYTIWLTGVPEDPSCNPDSWIQAHMIWHILCSFATLCFFNFYRKEQFNEK